MTDPGAFHSPHEWRIEFSDSDPDRRRRAALLDAPSEPHPWLTAAMRRALDRLVLVSNGPTQAWGPDAGIRKGTKAGSFIPVAPPVTAYDYETDFLNATTHRKRLALILDAQRAVRRATHADPSLIKGTPAWKARLAADTRPYSVLVKEYAVSKRTVVEIKREFGSGTNLASNAQRPVP